MTHCANYLDPQSDATAFRGWLLGMTSFWRVIVRCVVELCVKGEFLAHESCQRLVIPRRSSAKPRER